MRELAGRFERDSGLALDAEYGPTVLLMKRIAAGETPDVAILTKDALDGLVRDGAVTKGSTADIARSFVGVAVKAGAATPDISTDAAFIAVLKRARSIAYSRAGASGLFFAALLQ